MNIAKLHAIANQIPDESTRRALEMILGLLGGGDVNLNDDGNLYIGDGAVIPAKAAAVAGGIGLPFMLTATFADGATGDVAVYSANAPFKFRIIDAWVENDAANASNANSIQVCGAAAGADAITDAMDLNGKSAKDIVRATTIDKAEAEIAAGGSLYLRRTKAGGTMGGMVRVLAVKA